MISVRFQGKPFSITVIQVYAPTSDTEEAEVEQFCEELKTIYYSGSLADWGRLDIGEMNYGLYTASISCSDSGK